VAVNGKTGVLHEGVSLAASGSWSSLNSKAAGDSSLGSIGLVSELFSVTPFTPMSSHCSVPLSNDSVLSKGVSTLADKSDTLPVPSESQSPVADLSFALLDEVSSFDQKHRKKKKKKKKKKSRHSSLADVGDGDCKVVGNLDDLIAALQNVQMSSSDDASRLSQPSQPPTSFDDSRVLAKIFSQSSFSDNAATCFVVRGISLGCTGNSNVAVVSGNRSRIGRKTLPLVGSTAHAETRQSCLPPKKRHKLQMVPSVVPHAVDTGRVQGIGRGRRGRPPKLRTNQQSQKPHVKASKFCSKFLLFSVYHCYIIAYVVFLILTDTLTVLTRTWYWPNRGS